MTRRLLAALVAALLVLQVTVAPVSAAAFGLLGGSDDGLAVQRYGADGDPSYVVTLADGANASALEDWANASDQRRLVRLDEQAGVATVAAPFWMVEDVGARDVINAPSTDVVMALADTQLAEKSYIASVELNYKRSYAAPVEELVNVSDYTAPTIGALAYGDPAFNTDGIAFEGDANRTTMADSRAIVGADNVTETGEGVTVAVVDTGVNTANGRLFGNGTAGSDLRIANASKNFLTNETVKADGIDALQDGNGHGSWVASAIAANTTNTTHDGIAPDASLLVLKALNDDGSGSTADIAAAIRYAADHEADVISLSLGSPQYSPALADAIAYATTNGSVVVAAVGNSRQTTRWIATPADVDGVVSVAATNGSEPATAGSAYFSQLGPDPGSSDGSNGVTAGETVTVAAPGMQTVARVASEAGYVSNSTLSGTSMATPLVSGSIALAVEAHPSWNVSQTTDWVADSARPIPNAPPAEVGAGMVAADNLVDATEGDQSQRAAMDDAAQQRQTFWEALSDATGGVITEFLGDVL